MLHTPIILAAKDLPASAADCDCACPAGLPTTPAAVVLPQTLLECHPYHQAIALDPEFSVVFVPSLSQVAVLNQAALNVLRGFCSPAPLTGLAGVQRQVAEELLRLGLLIIPGATAAPPAEPTELAAWLHVTNACNLRCSYCYISKSDEAMSLATGQAAINTIFRSAAQHGYRSILLKYAGGEASLNLALVEALHHQALDLAAQAGIGLRGVVLSNGVGLTRQKLECIRALGLRLMISLDGPAASHDAQRPRLGGQGSFAAAAAAAQRAQRLGLDVTISVTVTGASVASLPELVDWLLARELHFSLSFYRENDCSANQAALRLDEQRLIDGMRAAYRIIEGNLPRYNLLGCLIDRANLGVSHRRTCAAGHNYLVIDHHGAVAACQMEIARPVATIWDADPLLAIRLDASGVQNLPVEQKVGCRECTWRYWCAGGCPVATFRATGRYDLRSPNCAIYQALYPEVLRLEGLRLRRWAVHG